MRAARSVIHRNTCPLHKHKLKVSGLVKEVAWYVDFHNLKLTVVAIQVSFDTFGQTELYGHFVAVAC